MAMLLRLTGLLGTKEDQCEHLAVKVNYVKPVTLEPVDGICEDCGSYVKLKWVSGR